MARRRSRNEVRGMIDMVDDDLPDGAYFAMCADVLGVDYGDVADELAYAFGKPEYEIDLPKKQVKRLAPYGELRKCSPHHYQIRSGERVVCDFWPNSRKYRIGNTGKAVRGDVDALAKALAQ